MSTTSRKAALLFFLTVGCSPAGPPPVVAPHINVSTVTVAENAFQSQLVPRGRKWSCFNVEYGRVAERGKRGRVTFDPASHMFGGSCVRKARECERQRRTTAKTWAQSAGRNAVRHLDRRCRTQPQAFCSSMFVLKTQQYEYTCSPTAKACEDYVEAQVQANEANQFSPCVAAD